MVTCTDFLLYINEHLQGRRNGFWIGWAEKFFIGDKKIFFAQIFSPKRAFPQILGGQLPTLPTRVRRPCQSCNLQYQSANDVQTCIDEKFSRKSSEAPCRTGFSFGKMIHLNEKNLDPPARRYHWYGSYDVWVPIVC